MIDISANICDDVFDKEFKRGSVIKTLFRFRDGSRRFKHCVILNNDISKEPTVFVLTTSQTSFYDKNPHFYPDIIRIHPKEIDFFPEETVINCREVHKLPKQVLKRNFQNGILKFVGILPSNIIQDIDKIITQSFLISNSDKKLILGK